MNEPADVNELLNAVLPFAHELLVKDGGFHPFGVTMSAEGELTAKGYELEEDDGEPERVLYALAEALREEAERDPVRALGICWDARIQTEEDEELRDAVAVAVETRTGTSLEVFVPYAPGVDEEGESTILFGEAVAEERRPSLFPGTDAPQPPEGD